MKLREFLIDRRVSWGRKMLETSLAQLNTEHVEVLVRDRAKVKAFEAEGLYTERTRQTAAQKRGDGGGACSL